ncbi:SRPBCC family protein [Paraconexibacter algicola]|uniref:SRPBCC family protein n=1 Tax=Paraconexibacter algicola TaxID=2133960 RepID=A0A2T4UKG6_9ACTN|nr:SRPBCC family protein [Paraconexibacter algicola]PTL59746.1 hypothetical protein C7Y72_08805 [Paraconexibacter algicola]
MSIEISQDIDVDATPEEAAALVADLPRWPEWFALHKGWSGDEPTGPAGKGTTFKHRIRVMGVSGDVTWKVAESDPPRRFRLEGKGPSRSNMEVDFRIAPRAGGGSTLSFTAKIGGLALRPFEGQIKPWLMVRVDRTTDALQQLLAA